MRDDSYQAIGNKGGFDHEQVWPAFLESIASLDHHLLESASGCSLRAAPA